MAELELTRTPGARRRYEIDGVGALRLGGMFSRGATAEAASASWAFDRRGFWQRSVEAVAATGVALASYDPRAFRRGGLLRWGGRDYALRPASRWKERYAVVD